MGVNNKKIIFMESLIIICLVGIIALFTLNIDYLHYLRKGIEENKQNENSDRKDWMDKYYELKWHINSFKTWGTAIAVTGGVFGFQFYGQLTGQLSETSSKIVNLQSDLESANQSITSLQKDLNNAENRLKGIGDDTKIVKSDLGKIKKDLSGTAAEIYTKYKLKDDEAIVGFLKENPTSVQSIVFANTLYNKSFDKRHFDTFKNLYLEVKNPDNVGASLTQQAYSTILYQNYPYEVSKDISLYSSMENFSLLNHFTSNSIEKKIFNCLKGFLKAISEKDGFIENGLRITSFTNYLSNYGAHNYSEFQKDFFDIFYSSLPSYEAKKYLFNSSDPIQKTYHALVERMLREYFNRDISKIPFIGRPDSLHTLIKLKEEGLF